MIAADTDRLDRRAPRTVAAVLFALFLAPALLGACTQPDVDGSRPQVAVDSAPDEPDSATTPPDDQATRQTETREVNQRREQISYAASEPARVVIPAIGVDANLARLGLEPDGAMEVPDFGFAGWYEKGPKPGDPGPSVIAAHVDSRNGPDVFYRLKELEPGNQIHVVYGSGAAVTFVARSPPEQTPKDELPGDKIWPVTNERLLTLITCGGIFDRSIGHYEDNIIVYAELVQDART